MGIMSVNTTTGEVTIDLKPDVWLSLDDQSKQLRGSLARWSVGDLCLYHSINKGSFFVATITKVSPLRGDVEIHLKPGQSLSLGTQRNILRPMWARGEACVYHSIDKGQDFEAVI